ncbi:hypothetical protein DPMN_130134 [Dreissena polymorpha]|uniref:Uncharacterized protein n=1 Tax=Dreissena polymorpha TaxID=45954 RepID=A0A9D4HAF2_DREPO|nr:hypothetical protein DPMN_130134 [Dreissena polymorpha]
MINVPITSHVIQLTGTIFELNSCIKETNVLSKFHENWAKIVTSRVFTRKTATPTCGYVFQRIGTTFELNQDIIKTNILTNFELGRDFIGTKLLTKFHADGTRNQMLTDRRTDIRRTKTGHKSSPEQSEEIPPVRSTTDSDAL